MMERGSAAVLASQVVRLIPSLAETQLSRDSERSAVRVGVSGRLEWAVAGCSG